MKQKIMILGGGEAQLGLIMTAKKMGLNTIVIGSEGKYIGYSLADKYIPVDILNKEEVLKIANAEKIDGVAMCCSDLGLSSLGYVCDKCGLKGISHHSASLSSNKLLMKEVLVENDIRTAQFRKIVKGDKYDSYIKGLQFPLIVKAVNLQGSKGIYICNSQDEVVSAVDKAFVESNLDYCLVEEFIVGEEFGAQAFVYDGNVVFVLPHGDRLAKVGATNIPIDHYVPYLDAHNSVLLNIVDLVKKSIKALEFDNCAVNVDMILKDKKPYVIELSGRAGANMLPEMVSEYYGINYYEMILRASLNASPEKYFDKNRHGMWGSVLTRVLYPVESGVIKIREVVSYDRVFPNIYISDGDSVKGLPILNRIGRILVHEESIEECTEKLNEYINTMFSIRMLS